MQFEHGIHHAWHRYFLHSYLTARQAARCNPDGTIVFSAQDIEVPEQFSQVATDILAQKYFRKAGVPAALKKIEENDVPSWLWRSVPNEKALAKLEEEARAIAARHQPDRCSTVW